VRRTMEEAGVIGSFALGGITAPLVEMLRDGLFTRLIEVQGSFVRDLRTYLNEASCVSDIQRIRRGWSPRSRARLAFEGDKIPTDHEHWYVYNTGGRNEAQFNVGLFPNYLRVGIGFEFTMGRHGNPEMVQAAYGAFSGILRQDRQDFEDVSLTVPHGTQPPAAEAGRLLGFFA
jgi:Citrate lyase, alpha subunit (CitF)